MLIKTSWSKWVLLCHGWPSACYHINLERIQTPALWNMTPLRHHLSGLTSTPWSGRPRPVPYQDRWLPSLVALLCHLRHVIYCLLLIFRWQHGMLPGLLWFTLTNKFTANKHNNLLHFSVLAALETWAEVCMKASQERPAHCHLKVVRCRMPAES